MSMESPLRAVAVCVGLPALTVLGGLWAAWGRTRRQDPAPAEITSWRSVLVGGALLAALALAWPLGLGLPQVPAASAGDKAAIERIGKACAAAKKGWGVVPFGPEHTDLCIDNGCRMISVGADVRILNLGIESMRQGFAKYTGA